MESTARDRVYGIDFSGAQDAGNRIWIAVGTPVENALRIDSCRPAKELAGSSKERAASLRALRELVVSENRAAFGFDFPFGLPQALVPYRNWESFVLAFPRDYPDPEAFRERCREVAQGRELKRLTDRAAQTPFSPYNIRLYRQTYYGLCDVLHPLVQQNQARVLPMEQPAENKPWLLEICPASTLKQQGLYAPYKGNDHGRCSARQRIVRALEQNSIVIPDRTLRAKILQDAGGDALDSVIAALAAFRALDHSLSPDVEGEDAYALEGYVYVAAIG
jgi:hypothetical protein